MDEILSNEMPIYFSLLYPIVCRLELGLLNPLLIRSIGIQKANKPTKPGIQLLLWTLDVSVTVSKHFVSGKGYFL